VPGRVTLRLGTRDSLLARAQGRLVVRALRAADPGIDVETVTIDTRGDRDRETPLAAVRDPGFFSAELDDALRAGAVDFCVHSLKDLPLGPRPGIRTAAIPSREDPRDVVLFRPEVPDLLRAGRRLRIGSSSERRVAWAGEFLAGALPRVAAEPPLLEFPPLRGPVEQRVARLRLPRAHARALDGAVLALAGLARLWGDRDGHAALAPLLEGTRLMVLPLSTCPAAPGQGALAVDCREGDARVAALLAAVDDADTARRARRELALLAARPQAERGSFAASSLRHPACGTLVFTRALAAGGDARRLLWPEPPRPAAARAWDGADWAGASECRAIARTDLGRPPALFAAHWRAWPAGSAPAAGTRLWVSGVESWRRLAAQGAWVEGCADNLGFGALLPLLRAPVLRLPPLADWTVLTREDAVGSWAGSGVGRVLATYAMTAPRDAAALGEIRAHVAGATHFFWGSAAQYRALSAWLPAGAHHACGPGKTFDALRAAGVANLRAFPSRREWRSWLA
jgi:hydroxymethylbilane synthase